MTHDGWDDAAWQSWFEAVGGYTDNMPTAMVTAIGRVAIASAKLDSLIQWDLSGIGSQIAARILLPDGAERLIPLARELVPVYFANDPATKTTLLEWFKALGPLRTERNKVIHGRWHVNAMVCYRSSSRQLKPSKQAMSVGDIEVWTIEQVNELADRFIEHEHRLTRLVTGKLPHFIGG